MKPNLPIALWLLAMSPVLTITSCKPKEAPPVSDQTEGTTGESSGLAGSTLRTVDGADWLEFRDKGEIEIGHFGRESGERKVLLGTWAAENSKIRIVFGELGGKEVIYLERKDGCYACTNRRLYYSKSDLEALAKAQAEVTRTKSRNKKQALEASLTKAQEKGFSIGPDDPAAKHWLSGKWMCSGVELKLDGSGADDAPGSFKITRITPQQDAAYRQFCRDCSFTLTLDGRKPPTHMVQQFFPGDEHVKPKQVFSCYLLPADLTKGDEDKILFGHSKDSPELAWEEFMTDRNRFAYRYTQK